jgi:hypothetical protein
MGARIADFDQWREGYAGATVEFRVAGTNVLAPLFLDEDLTESADNPQILESYSDGNGFSYGKFEQPVYIGVDYTFVVNSIDESGVIRLPILSLEGQSIIDSTAKPRSSSFERRVQDLFANAIYAADYGPLSSGGTAIVNAATLNIAIGQAAAQGGGFVFLPAGSFAITTLTLPRGVVLVGAGETATFLQSQEAQAVITLGGNGAGLVALTLDGINLIANSIGIYGDAKERIVLNNVTVKRFSTGIHLRGGKNIDWSGLSIDNCSYGCKLHGDMNVSGGNVGSELLQLTWRGGVVSTCLTVGVEMSYEDTKCSNVTLDGIAFDLNTGIAVHINGGQYIRVDNAKYNGNTDNIKIEDDDQAAITDNAKILGVYCRNGEMRDGNIRLEDTCEDVIFQNYKFQSIDFILTVLSHNVLLLNCAQDTACTVSGDTTKLQSDFQAWQGNTVGVTTDATVTKAWSTGPLEPGQIVVIDVTAIGNSRNSAARAIYRRFGRFLRAASTLAYDGQTANFTLGQIVTGAVSGATARIIADADAGATGTLSLRDIQGAFVDNEAITDGAGGTALANGTLVAGTVSALTAANTIGTDYEDVAGWDFALATTSQEVEARVTGAAATTIEWTVQVTAIYD